MSFDRMGGRMPGQDVVMDRPSMNHDDSFDSLPSPGTRPTRTRGHTQSSSMSSPPGSTPVSPGAKREGFTKRLSKASFETMSTLRNGSNSRTSGITKRAMGSTASTPGQGSRSASVASKGDNDYSPHTPHMLNESVVDRGRPVPSVFSPFELSNSTRKPSEYAAPPGASVFSPFEAHETKNAAVIRKGSELDAPGGFSTFSPFQAPEPTVSGDSRKLSAPLSPVLSQISSRKNSPRIPSAPSQTSLVNDMQTKKKSTGHEEIPQAIRDQASDFVRASTMRSTSKSPNVSPYLEQGGFTTPQRYAGQEYVSPAHVQKHSSGPLDAAREKEKSGFFRRVFKNTGRSVSAQELQKQDSRASSVQSVHRSEEMSSSKTYKPSPAQVTSQPRPEPGRAESSPASGTINKKSSSFFRRRKRSTTEDELPPSIAPQFIETPMRPRQEPKSPGASSLTRAMDQYLENVDSTSQETKSVSQVPMSNFTAEGTEEEGEEDEDEEDDDPDMFHSGYTPPPDASLRRPAPHEHSRNTTPAATPKPSPMLSQLESDSEDEGTKSNTLKVKDKARPHNLSANSFLNENSDMEGRKSKASSIISAISSTYGLPADNFHSPVSPMSAREVEGIITYFSPMADPRGTSSVRPVADSPQGSFVGDGPDFVVTAPSRRGTTAQSTDRPERLRLEPATAEEEDKEETDAHSMSLPVEGIRLSDAEASEPAPSLHSEDHSLPMFKLEGKPSGDMARSMSPAPSSVNPDEPTSEDKERARQIYDGDEEVLLKDEAAAWLGERKPQSARVLVAYMALFNWSGQNIVSAMRSLCGRLVLKGESQQVDRILEAFGQRWDQCNPRNGFKGTSKCHLL